MRSSHNILSALSLALIGVGFLSAAPKTRAEVNPANVMCTIVSIPRTESFDSLQDAVQKWAESSKQFYSALSKCPVGSTLVTTFSWLFHPAEVCDFSKAVIVKEDMLMCVYSGRKVLFDPTSRDNL